MPNYNDIWCHFGLGRPPTVGALCFLPSVSDVAGSTCEPPHTACSRSESDQPNWINSTNLTYLFSLVCDHSWESIHTARIYLTRQEPHVFKLVNRVVWCNTLWLDFAVNPFWDFTKALPGLAGLVGDCYNTYHTYTNKIPILPLRFGAIVLGSAAQRAEVVASCLSGCLFCQRQPHRYCNNSRSPSVTSRQGFLMASKHPRGIRSA